MESKEEQVLKLFFEEPTREWHFEEVLKTARISRSKAVAWLRLFVKEELIIRVKKKNQMPFYLSNHQSPAYRNKKKIYALECFYRSGFLNHLSSLKAKSVIIFGSFARSDWYKNSDIDLFVYGDPEGLNVAKYELALHHPIEVFACQNKKELAKMGSALMRNIIKGNLIKGDLDFVKVEINA